MNLLTVVIYFYMVVMTHVMLWMAKMSSLNLLSDVDSLARVGLLLLADVDLSLLAYSPHQDYPHHGCHSSKVVDPHHGWL